MQWFPFDNELIALGTIPMYSRVVLHIEFKLYLYNIIIIKAQSFLVLLLGASTPPHLLLMMFISWRGNKCLKFHGPVPFNSFGEEKR